MVEIILSIKFLACGNKDPTNVSQYHKNKSDTVIH